MKPLTEEKIAIICNANGVLFAQRSYDRATTEPVTFNVMVGICRMAASVHVHNQAESAEK